MRRALEITFAGEEYKVIVADSMKAALASAGDADVFVVDTTLDGDDGYAVAKELRKLKANAPMVLLSSRHNPYDQAKGKEAGADDFADKPFDSQALIDKVKKLVASKDAAPAPKAPSVPPVAAAVAADPIPTPAAAAAPYRAPQPSAPSSPMAAATPPAIPSVAKPQAPSFPRPPMSSSPGLRPSAPTPAATSAHAPAATGSVANQVNGQMAGKLGELGLSPEQAQAVLALSREVVERVVWEIVPQLAETIIKEEIARLTRE